MSEEARAAAYRTQAKNRRDWRALNEVLLTPAATARDRVAAAWQPLVDALRERRYGKSDGQPEQPSDRYNG